MLFAVPDRGHRRAAADKHQEACRPSPLRSFVAALPVALLFVAGALVAAGVGSSPAAAAPADGAHAGAAPAPQAKWTVMVYMCGDNDLEPWLPRQIDRQLATVGSSADVQVVALADRGRHPSGADGAWTGARLFHVTRGMTGTSENAVADWGNANMGSPQTLVNFVTWTRANYPADHYALFLWDHGWGWWPHETMKDVTSNDTLDMEEIRSAMQAVAGVDMVGMDTCLGQMIEVEAQFRGFADAVAGTQDSTGYSGFYYPQILSRLQAEPAMSAARLATVAAQSMKSHHDRWTLASSAVALNVRWDALTSAVSDLAWDLQSGLPKYRRAYALARRHAEIPCQVPYQEVRDLYDAAYELKMHVASPLIRKDCTKVMWLIRRVVLYEWSTKAEGDLHGISIFWPAAPAPPHKGSSFSQWVNFPYYCAQLMFTRLTYWGDFLISWGG
jgi:hypothetical protein